jgi:hypothetical protein
MAELVFVGGSWRQIPMPIETTWTLEYRQVFACAVVGFERQGFCETEAVRLAECLVYKLIHRGLKYDTKTESIIEGLWGIA